MSRTFQHSKLFNRLSALDNVLVGAHLVSFGLPGVAAVVALIMGLSPASEFLTETVSDLD